MDCSPPGFSVHGILQARILEWVCHFLLQKSMHLWYISSLPLGILLCWLFGDHEQVQAGILYFYGTRESLISPKIILKKISHLIVWLAWMFIFEKVTLSSKLIHSAWSKAISTPPLELAMKSILSKHQDYQNASADKSILSVWMVPCTDWLRV